MVEAKANELLVEDRLDDLTLRNARVNFEHFAGVQQL